MKAVLAQRIVTPSGVVAGAILIDHGKIAEVLPALPEGFSGAVTDYGNKVVLPGLVDTHVHINEPGRTEWEGYETATRAAASGGITTLCDMPLNCSPVTVSEAALSIKLESLRGKLSIDCGFWGGVIPSSIANLDKFLKSPIKGVKSFMIDSGLAEFPPLTVAELEQACHHLARHGKPYLIHAELFDEVADHPGMPKSYAAFVASRPKRWENRAISIMIDLAETTGAHIHIVHLSSAEALPMIRAAKARGLKFTVETCPHYLVLNEEEIGDGKTLFKCCPPIREKANQSMLWEALRDGTIDFVVSDHSPCSPGLKLMEEGDFAKAWGGIASLQFLLPLVGNAALERGFGLEQIAKILAKGAANLMGMDHQKGQIAPGYDADLCIWDDAKAWRIGERPIFHRHQESPYKGKLVKGLVSATWLGGECIFSDDQFLSSARGQALV